MNPIQVIATLRKFGNYLAGLFPVLVTIADAIAAPLRRLLKYPKVASVVESARQSIFLQSVWKILERFYWRTYSKDRLDLSETPPACLPVLRPIFQLCAVLCVLIPFAAIPLGIVPLETFSGFKGAVPVWSIIVWIIAYPSAWAALLTGSAVSNRLFFCCLALAALYMCSTCVILLPRSYANLFLAAAVLSTLVFCERTLPRRSGIARAGSWLNALIVGMAAGIEGTVLTPFRPLLGKILPVTGPVVGIACGSAIGVVLGLSCLGIARWLAKRDDFESGAEGFAGESAGMFDRQAAPVVSSAGAESQLTSVGERTVSGEGDLELPGTSSIIETVNVDAFNTAAHSSALSEGESEKEISSNLRLASVMWLTYCLLLSYLAFALLRGGFVQVDGLILSSLDLSNAYLWPIIYFIGVGILHKLMGSSKVLATSVQSMIPGRFLVPILMGTLILATATAFSDRVCQYLSQQNDPLSASLLSIFYPLYSATKGVLWSNPFNGMGVHWFSWILLTTLVISLTLLAQRRLNSSNLSRLFFMCCLSALLIWEYIFQWSSFNRTPTHSMLVLVLFALWLLWLMHTVGWNFSVRSSPWWPSQGRFAVYAGILTLIILQINARAACKDFRIVNEIFLSMFRGVIDVGLPYYLLIWATRRLPSIRLPASEIFKSFLAGAVSSFAFNYLDKLAACAWSYSRLSALLATQLERWKTLGSATLELSVPTYWFYLKAALYVGLLVLVSNWGRRWAKSENKSHLIVFLLLSFASGVVSFSRTLVDLPLPLELSIMVVPMAQELSFNCNIFVGYLAYWIPALLIAVSVLLSLSPSWLMGTVILAIAFNGFLLYGYQEWEPFLRATDLLYPVLTVLTAIFACMIMVALSLLGSDESDIKKTGAKAASSSRSEREKAALLSPGTFSALVLSLSTAYLLLSIGSNHLELVERNVEVFKHPVLLASSWRFTDGLQVRQAENPVALYWRQNGSIRSVLELHSLPADAGGVKKQLQGLVNDAIKSGAYKNLQIVSVSSWSKYFPDAICCHYSYEIAVGKNSLTLAGLSVIVPMGERNELFVLSTDPGTIDSEQWELILAVRQLRAQSGGKPSSLGN